MAINGVGSWIREQEGEDMEWARTLAYITGTVDQELLLRNEYLVAENRILKAQLKERLRPACPKCQARMLLARIAPVRLGVDLHTFECEVCDHVLETLTACEDPMQSKIVGRWIQGDLHSPK